jgi:hypothetical protein
MVVGGGGFSVALGAEKLISCRVWPTLYWIRRGGKTGYWGTLHGSRVCVCVCLDLGQAQEEGSRRVISRRGAIRSSLLHRIRFIPTVHSFPATQPVNMTIFGPVFCHLWINLNTKTQGNTAAVGAKAISATIKVQYRYLHINGWPTSSATAKCCQP